MVRIQIISGKMAGSETVARHFPFTLGRSHECELRLEDEGVWDKHCEFTMSAKNGFVLTTHSEAIVLVDGENAAGKMLKNGATLDIGAAKVRFWLSDTRQKAFHWRETFTWFAFLMIFIVEIYLVYRINP